MKKIKYIISIFAVALLASCTQEIQAPIISVRTVTIDQGDQALAVGQSVKLTASVQPVNATDRDLKWSSSNEDIAMVSAGGKVKALSVGEVAITAEAGGVSDLITVKVVAKLVPVNGVSINPSSTTLKLGETQLLKAEITPSDATNTSVKWASSNDRVASVEKGLITGLKPGTATITATTNDGNRTAECAVTVEDEPLPVATLDADNVSPVSAVLNGKVIAAEVSPGIMVGFQYAETPSDLPFNSTTLEAAISNSEYNFSAGISGLEPGTTYCFRSVIRLNDEEYYGEIKTFVTQSPESLFSYIEIPESDIKQTSVVLKVATALSNVLYESISYGFMWGTEESALNNTLPANLVSEGIIQATLTDLSYETKYYYKAFVIIDGLKLDSPQWDVTTLHFIMESVDLGLSVKWANANLGAQSPSDGGDFYAWGETEPYYIGKEPFIWKSGKENGYDWATYSMCLGSYNTLTKYNTQDSFGSIDNKSVLRPEDDAANVALGGDWRMPTDAEWTELRTECSWEWIIKDGRNCQKVIGPNGNSIIIPTPGLIYGTDLVGKNAAGSFWSSSLYLSSPFMAWDIYFDMNSDGIKRRNDNRSDGRSIRPVEGSAPANDFTFAAVDLGLPSGLKWANANLGADSEEKSGDFFAWGETESYYSSFDPLTWKDGKSAGYNNASYKFYSGGTYTKYYSSVDSKKVLDPEDDAAHVLLGDAWRMPTKDEWTELINNCEWTWVSSGGKIGYTVTGTNANSIFIPASGLMSNKSLDNVGFGNYWTADLDDSFKEYAHYYAVSNEYLKYSMPFYYTNSYYRYYGYTIRAVTE